MKQSFKSLSNKEDIDLIPYIKNYMKENSETELFVGCDSQNFKDETSYASVIVLYKPGKGGHVLYMKERCPKIKDRYTRLWSEVEKSVDIANSLCEAGIKKPEYIDLDLNPNPRFKSNMVLKAAIGYVESFGYNPRVKPEAVSASYMADYLCH